MVCTIRGKHCHFCIGRAQSMHCAMMQHMTAVGHRHVCPTLTNRLVNPEPSDASTDRQGTLGSDPRAGTNFVLGPLSDRTRLVGALW